MAIHKIILLSGLIAFTAVASCQSVHTREKEESLPIVCGVPPNEVMQKKTPFEKSLFNSRYKWAATELRVFFVDMHNKETIRNVLKIANEWSIPGRIKFVQAVSLSKSDIRVAFRQGNGYTSSLGSQAAHAAGQVTMWLENLDKKDTAEFRRTVLHEFGHALGFRHELQNPNSPIEWNDSAVYAYFKTKYKWDSTAVQVNVLNKVRLSQTVKATQFDPESVMIYAVPAFLTRNYKEIVWPLKLSETDKKTLAEYY